MAACLIRLAGEPRGLIKKLANAPVCVCVRQPHMNIGKVVSLYLYDPPRPCSWRIAYRQSKLHSAR